MHTSRREVTIGFRGMNGDGAWQVCPLHPRPKASAVWPAQDRDSGKPGALVWQTCFRRRPASRASSAS